MRKLRRKIQGFGRGTQGLQTKDIDSSPFHMYMVLLQFQEARHTLKAHTRGSTTHHQYLDQSS
jgi:hypothetical protein